MIRSPGLSSVPASKLPIITELAPTAKAFDISPEYLIPPSAIIGTPNSLPASLHSSIALI